MAAQEQALPNAKRELREFWSQTGYFHLGYSQSTQSVLEEPLISYLGGHLTAGQSFFLHKPIFGVAAFAIDVSFVDINYENYAIQYIKLPLATEDYWVHKATLSIQAGPSLTINPTGKIGLKLYGKIAPALVMYFQDDSTFNNFGLYNNFGAVLSFGKVGLGVEHHFGTDKIVEYLPYRDYSKEASPIEVEKIRAFLYFRFK